MGNSENFTVSGILHDLPNNTQFDFFEYLISYELQTQQGSIDKDWSNISVPTFVLLKPNSKPEQLNAKLKKYYSRPYEWHSEKQKSLYIP